MAGGLLASVAVFASGIVALAVAVPDGGPPHPDRWDPRVVELVAFVERARGHDFAEPVHVDFLTPDGYAAETREDEEDLTERDRLELDRQAGFLRALGLAEGELDLLEARNDIADSGTLAYYDPDEERITVRGTAVTPALEVTLVHELTHVLQDQVFDVRRIEHEAGPGASDAVRGLLEGDAGRIEQQYVEQELSDDERGEYERSSSAGAEEGEEALEEVPGAFVELFAAPYALGQPLVQTLGTNRRIDRALSDDLPRSDEALWYAASYFEQDGPEDVDPPEPAQAGRDRESGTFGPILWYLVLARVMDPVEAMRVVDGWGGDAYTAVVVGGDEDEDEQVCIDAVLVGEARPQSSELRWALERWTAYRPEGSDVEVRLVGDEVRVHVCDPGADAEADFEPDVPEDALTVPVVRAYAYLVARRDIGADVARCAADGAIARFDAGDLVDPDARIFADGSFFEALREAGDRC